MTSSDAVLHANRIGLFDANAKYIIQLSILKEIDFLEFASIRWVTIGILFCLLWFALEAVAKSGREGSGARASSFCSFLVIVRRRRVEKCRVENVA